MGEQMPPVVLVETGCGPEGLEDPVTTHDDRVTVVCLTWDRPMPKDPLQRALGALKSEAGLHPRIGGALARLRAAIGQDRA